MLKSATVFVLLSLCLVAVCNAASAKRVSRIRITSMYAEDRECMQYHFTYRQKWGSDAIGTLRPAECDQGNTTLEYWSDKTIRSGKDFCLSTPGSTANDDSHFYIE